MASANSPASTPSPPNRTSRLSAKCRKNVARFKPARSAICVTVVSSYPFSTNRSSEAVSRRSRASGAHLLTVTVLGLARSDASAKAVADMGTEVLRGDLNDTDVLRAGALDSAGVIHLAFVVPSVTEAATRTDARAIETFATSLAGAGKPLVISGGTLVRPGRPPVRCSTLSATKASPSARSPRPSAGT
jgi:hypothetical protein